jgi:DNA-binding GntR family transcriptional regulator
VQYDIRFHSFLIDKAASPMISEVWELMKNRIAFIQSYTKEIRQDGPRQNMCERHRYIIEAIKKGDKQFCMAAVAEHIRSTKSRKLPSANNLFCNNAML